MPSGKEKTKRETGQVPKRGKGRREKERSAKERREEQRGEEQLLILSHTMPQPTIHILLGEGEMEEERRQVRQEEEMKREKRKGGGDKRKRKERGTEKRIFWFSQGRGAKKRNDRAGKEKRGAS